MPTRLILAVTVILPVALLAQSTGTAKRKQTFNLTAGGLPEGSSIPRQFTCDGTGVSLPVSWSSEPEGAQSFALIMEDPDARDLITGCCGIYRHRFILWQRARNHLPVFRG